MSKPTDNLENYWRGLSQRKTRLKVLGADAQDGAHEEFPPGADELVVEGGASRRKFMGILGASTALAGLTSAGCVRKPVEHIVPFAKRPEDRIPGVPVYYATAIQVGGTVQGLLVESHDGRPTKIEGNPQHAGSAGGTDVFAQASLLNLYDPERSTKVRSTVASANATGPAAQLDNHKHAAVEALCHDIHERTLAETNSVDAADKAKARCAKAAEEHGRWRIIEDEHGPNVTAEINVDWDHQIDTTWESAWAELVPKFESLHAAGGQGLALVVPGSMSPTFRSLQQRFVQTYPQAKVVLCDPTYPINTIRAAEMVGGEGARSFHSLEDAKLVVAVDSDFLATETDHVRLASEWAKGRRVANPGDEMSRLYVVEPHLSGTGTQADHRLRLPSRDIVDFLIALAIELVETHGVGFPTGAEALGAALKTRGQFDPRTQAFIEALAADLVERAVKPSGKPGARGRDKIALLVGERQPPLAHGLGYLINAMLLAAAANPPATLRFTHRLDHVPMVGLADLAADLESGAITHVVCLGTNPAYDSPGVLNMRDKLGKAQLLVHAGSHVDETGQMATWHLPTSHYLEAWGDLEASDGTVSIQQPLIAPLHGTRSLIEILNMMIPTKGADGWQLHHAEVPGLDVVRGYWNNEIATGSRNAQALSDQTWQTWLHDGLVSGIPRSRSTIRPSRWRSFSDLLIGRKVEDAPYEVNFHLDPKVLAGEYSNNAWMQELPHPMSKLVWDNGAYISATLAAELGVENGDNLAIKVGDASVQVPAWIAPGQHDRTVSLNLGYGRKGIGTVAEDAGFDVHPLRQDEARWFVNGEVSRGSGHYELVSTQDFGSLDPDGKDGTPIGINYEPRPIYRETTTEGFEKDPDFAKRGDLMSPEQLKSPWSRYDPETDPTLSVPVMHGPHQWGMAIDLNTCTNCNACVVACQAENNIAVVGKKECSNGREMHWIRLDRYYTGAEDNPKAAVMPMLCQHCETAPCENVCPVAATAHSPEGLNDMAYNRCVGTRYCANNCPYKVRRFNFFNYNRHLPVTRQMAENPDVTVRFRGVIEKCSYCVQRINHAKIEAHVDGRDKVRDGDVIVACQQVCPTQAITFGDLTDPDSAVSNAKFSTKQEDYREREPSKRNYGVLTDLNTQPRTTYLGRVRNPNPKLA